MRNVELKKAPCLPCSKSAPVHALAYACTRSRDEQRPSRFQVAARAFLAVIHRCRVPLPVACLQAGRYRPRRSSVTQMYTLELCQCV